MNYHGKIFQGRTNSSNGEVNQATVFYYHQTGDRLFGEYSGGSIIEEHLLGKVHSDDSLEFYYHHLNTEGTLRAGKCHSFPYHDANGKLVLQEHWEWFTGDRSSGKSEVEEILR